MGLFNFFRTNKPTIDPPITEEIITEKVVEETIAKPIIPDIPREIFIEENEPQNLPNMISTNGEANGIEVVYAFLQSDYETKGYSDALTNADASNKSDAIKLIKLDLQILIKRVTNYYENKVKDYNFHIESRGRAGLVDLVEEIKLEKEKAEKDMAEVKIIASEIDSGTGMVERIILSYQKGFMRGLSAITQSKIFK